MSKLIKVLGLLMGLCYLNTGSAQVWQNLWHTPDQVAQKFMHQKDYNQAEKWFKRADWRAVAAYRAHHYQAASSAFKALGTADGFYNQGNALAYLGQYQQAIAAYDKALALDKNNKDAQFNRQLIQELLKKSSKQPENSSQKDNPSSEKNKAPNAPKSADKDGSSPKNTKKSNKNDGSQKDQSSDKSTESKPQSTSANPNKSQKSPEPKPSDSKQNSQSKDQATKLDSVKPNKEKSKANQQWLNLIPDEPEGLLREKFLRDYHRRHSGAW